jgi:hypothetical protein
MAELPAAAEAGTLASTDAVRPNGTVVFRLEGHTAAPNGSTLGDGLRFTMQQTDRSTTPQRLPIRLNTSASSEAVRTFAVDGDQYVAVDMPNATWTYDGQPGTTARAPKPRVGQGYTATLSVTSNGTTAEANTTIAVTEPGIVGDVEVAAGGVAQLNVSVAGGWTATLVIGNESVGYRVARRVVDENADGHVRVEFDTGAAGTDAAFSAVGADSVAPHPQSETFAVRNGTLAPGDYPLAAGTETPQTLVREHRSWESTLVVVEATPTPAPATATTTATEPSTTTTTDSPTGTATPTAPPARSTTDSPGFGSLAALLAVAVLGVSRARRR